MSTSSSQPDPITSRLRRRSLRGVGVVVALLLFAAIVAQVIRHNSSTAATSIVWHEVEIPSGVTFPYFHALAIAPSDGDLAYACALSAKTQGVSSPSAQVIAPAIWVTRDRAAHWRKVANLPTSRADINACWLTVDELDPSIAVAVVAWPQRITSLTPDTTVSFVTTDGGATWRQLANDMDYAISEFVTQPKITYAYLFAPLAAPLQHNLLASYDGMHVWRPVDQSIVESGQHVQRFWVMPDTREILAEAGIPGTGVTHLWLTHDGGAQWVQLPSPDATYFVVQTPVADQQWHMCAVHYAPSNASNSPQPLPDRLECSEDSGRTWVQRPILAISSGGTGGHSPGQSTEERGVALIALTHAGDVLFDDNLADAHSLYRLTEGSNKWQYIGALPRTSAQSIVYVAAPNAGVLWALPVTTITGIPTDPHLTADYP